MNESDKTLTDGAELDSFPSTVLSQVAEVDGDRRPAAAPGIGEGASVTAAVAGRYRWIEQLTEQDLGTLYLAEDDDLRRRVLLKAIHRDSPHLQRFIEAARVMGQLDHPNIASVHELGLNDGERLYCTMPWVPGRSLAEMLAEIRRDLADTVAGSTGLNRLVQIFLQICLGVQFAHLKGVVHRDLHPGNVWLGKHGEVQVTGWAFARIYERGAVETQREGTLTRIGEVLGTPAYMSPEQAAGGNVGPAADIYSLGVMLYEMLCLETPFDGTDGEVCGKHMTVEPVPPRQRSPMLSVPASLEQICLRAMSKESCERPATVAELHDAVQSWLEQESDRSRAQARAAALAELGFERLQEYRRMTESIREREVEAADLARRFSAQSTPLSGDASAGAERVALGQKGHGVVATLCEAIGIDGHNQRARSLLAEYYWDWFQDAEARSDFRERDFYRRMVERYHGGRYSEALLGQGVFAVESDPPGANAWLYTYVEKDLCLQARDEQRLSATPVAETPVPMGSYLLVLKHEDRRVVRCPFRIGRQGSWRARIRLPLVEEVAAGFLFIPGGVFLTGGGREPLREAETGEYCISEHPVTIQEYLEFLRQLAITSPAEARARAPRKVEDAPRIVIPDAGRILLPGADDELGRWLERWPVFGVSADDADAYARYRAAKDGRSYRLPTALEWEKAARGVDGRGYPWGDRFDPSLCNGSESHESGPRPEPVEEFPNDVSPYGLRGAAGNVREWTSTRASRGRVVVCGGSYKSDAAHSHVAERGVGIFSEAEWDVGFRLVHAR